MFNSSVMNQIGQQVTNQLVKEVVLTAAASSISFSNLDGLADGGYVLELVLFNASASLAATPMCCINGDKSGANYGTELVTSIGTATTVCSASAGWAGMLLGGLAAGLASRSYVRTDIQIANGYVYLLSQTARSFDTIHQSSGGWYKPSVTNLTSLYIYASSDALIENGSWAAGSTARLYRKKTATNAIINPSANMLVADVLVPANTTTVTLSGLDANLHGGYILNAVVNNTLGSTANIGAYINGDMVDTNYYDNYFKMDGAIIAGARINTPVFGTLLASSTIVIEGTIDFKALQSRALMRITWDYNAPSALMNFIAAIHSVTAITNVTSLTFQASVAGAIGAGSRFRLYRRK